MNDETTEIAEIANALMAKEYRMIGSTYALGAGQDVDWLVLTTGMQKDQVDAKMRARGFRLTALYIHMGESAFASYQRGNLNVILTSCGHWYRDFLQATEVAKYLKLTSKKDRIAVCRIVRDRLTADDLTEKIADEDLLEGLKQC